MASRNLSSTPGSICLRSYTLLTENASLFALIFCILLPLTIWPISVLPRVYVYYMDVVGWKTIKHRASQRGIHPGSFTRRPFILN
jgi:hypothetical protein